MSNEPTPRARVPEHWKWFVENRLGLFIHWGPSAEHRHGEQVMFREHLDVAEYERAACAWNPRHYDPAVWASTARKAGTRYACLTARHHDGYCLWDTAYTDYSSARQAPKRDFLREYVEAFRREGLKIGIYYSWLDWRIPAFFEGPDGNPDGWRTMKEYMHGQVTELMSNYGTVDYFFFDGSWPRKPEELGSAELIRKMRELQPGILITGEDFAVCENTVTPDPSRLWECCQVSTWRLWGYTEGERWRSTDQILDILCDCAVKGGGGGGNLLLNVGPQADGQLPPQFVERALELGAWLEVHGEAINGTDGGDVTEFVTRGRQTTSGNNLYLIVRFWDGRPQMRLPDLVTPVKRVTLLTTGQELGFSRLEEGILITGLPRERPTRLFPVIKIECDGRPAANQWGRERLWSGDPTRIARWARTRGESVYVGGRR
jgi:alpha-L-fucosidase